MLPGGPGHSHQGVGDIATLGHIPGMKVLVPGCEEDVELLLNWAVFSNKASTYFRIESIPIALDFKYDAKPIITMGHGIPITEGAPIKLIAYGPTMLAVALDAKSKLKNEFDVCVEVVNFPWVNYVDRSWLSDLLKETTHLIVLENHFAIGGLADKIASGIACCESVATKFSAIGISEIPVGGSNSEVLGHHSMDCASVVRHALSEIKK